VTPRYGNLAIEHLMPRGGKPTEGDQRQLAEINAYHQPMTIIFDFVHPAVV